MSQKFPQHPKLGKYLKLIFNSVFMLPPTPLWQLLLKTSTLVKTPFSHIVTTVKGMQLFKILKFRSQLYKLKLKRINLGLFQGGSNSCGGTSRSRCLDFFCPSLSYRVLTSSCHLLCLLDSCHHSCHCYFHHFQ